MQFPWDEDVQESSFERSRLSWTRVTPTGSHERSHTPSTLEKDPPGYNSSLSRREIRKRRERLEEERRKQAKKAKRKARPRPPAHASGKTLRRKKSSLAVPLRQEELVESKALTEAEAPHEEMLPVNESNSVAEVVQKAAETADETELRADAGIQEETSESEPASAPTTTTPDSLTALSFGSKFARRDVAVLLLAASALGLGTLGALDDFTSPPRVYADTEELVRQTTGEVVAKSHDTDYCPSNLYGAPVNSDERNWAQSSGVTGQDGQPLVCLDSPYSLTVAQEDGEEVRIPVEYVVYETHAEGDNYSFDEDLHARGIVTIRSTLPPEEHPELRYALLASAVGLGVAAVRIGVGSKKAKN